MDVMRFRTHAGGAGWFAALAVFFLAASLAGAQAPSEEASATLLLLDSQISQGLFLSLEGRAQMQEVSAGLTDEQRSLLYTARKRDDALFAAIFNTGFFGLGSALQSDWGAAALVLGMRVGGGIAFGLGLGTAMNGGNNGPLPESLSGYFFVGGLALVVSSLVVGALRPFFWVPEWNSDLALALGTDATAPGRP